jgi:hypothetical protein
LTEKTSRLGSISELAKAEKLNTSYVRTCSA